MAKCELCKANFADAVGHRCLPVSTPSPRPTYEELVEALDSTRKVLVQFTTPPFGTSVLEAFVLAIETETKARSLLTRCRQGGESNNG